MSKSPDAFRTISEVAEDLDLPQHVLRFWETRFSQIKPMKRGGGRRYYRPDDVELLSGIRHLLYNEGYTIRGVQKLLKEHGNKYVVAFGKGEAPSLPSEAAPVAGQMPPATPQSAAPAVSVAELTSQPKGGSKGGGILGRLRGGGSETAPEAELSINADDRRSLQATLFELLECKRLLDQVR